MCFNTWQETPGQVPQSGFTANNLIPGNNANGQTAFNDFTPTINNATGAAQQTSGAQGNLAGLLQQQAIGQGPAAALAQQQMNQNLAQSQQSAAATAASQKGISGAGSAMYNAAQNQANQAQAGAGQAAQQRLQSQLGATGELGNVLSQQQSGNLGLLNAGIGGQNAQNQALITQNQGTNSLNQNTANANAGIQQQAQGLNASTAASNATTGEQTLTGLTQMMGSGVGFADGGMAYASGGSVVPGDGSMQRAGDDTRNDTHPYMLSEGEGVLSKDMMSDPDAAKAFVQAMQERGSAGGSAMGFGEVLREVQKLSAKAEGLKKIVQKQKPSKKEA